uniref:Transmembrane protein putative n=1 Tax=Albugo laibachii Nc14 TaxID=890382 RepID=F0WHZ5_9STRA|nr:transmembrane protein putative [Albugo laibachii Nc14]|eukprot:CCA20872.1 transmembrane protein putative [Albugo laibachii Nc14]
MCIARVMVYIGMIIQYLRYRYKLVYIMVRKGRSRPNIAGERYDSNALSLEQNYGRKNEATNSETRPMPMGMEGFQEMMKMMRSGQSNGMVPPEFNGIPHGVIVYHGISKDTPIDRSFITIYPNYINALKALALGRRTPKSQACDNPLVEELSEICAYFNLPHLIETHKRYPRDWMVLGRVRVRLRNASNEWENPNIQSRKQLMVQMGSLIPKLQSRAKRLEKEAAEAVKKSLTVTTAAAVSSSSIKKKGKKKGKK